jgi:thiol-disulfide isomerase/thioredoxin
MRLILQMLFLASAISTSAYASTPGEIEIGGYLREATLQGINSKANRFSDFKGKPLIINVWASWCGPCKDEMGSLEQLARRYNGNEFNLIGISIDDDGNAAAAFIEQFEITFKNFLDSNVFLENMLGANTIPMTILVDSHGRVLAKARGKREWYSPEVVAAIGEVFKIELMY